MIVVKKKKHLNQTQTHLLLAIAKRKKIYYFLIFKVIVPFKHKYILQTERNSKSERENEKAKKS